MSQREVASVRSAEDLAAVLARLRQDLAGSGQNEWENATLDHYLDALAAVVEDRALLGPLSWANVADMLVTATGYE